MTAEHKRRCRWVEERLDRYIEDDMGRVRKRLIARHLASCPSCAAMEGAVRELAAVSLHAAAPTTDSEPPSGLLDDLLRLAQNPSIAQRAAVPARGAVSGARPGLSAVAILVLAGLVASVILLVMHALSDDE